VSDSVIEFPTNTDRVLFEVALNSSARRGTTLLEELHEAYGVVERISEEPRPIEWNNGESMVYYFRGAVSPLVAAYVVQLRETGESCPVRVRHVWLRYSRAHDELRIVDGHPDGKGGSFRATVVECPNQLGGYSVAVDAAPVRGRATAEHAAVCRQFVEGLLC
jgi:hypothetical protein